MRVGLIIGLHGFAPEDAPPGAPLPPTWPSVLAQAEAAEAAGFDLVCVEDALLALPDGRPPVEYRRSVTPATTGSPGSRRSWR